MLNFTSRQSIGIGSRSCAAALSSKLEGMQAEWVAVATDLAGTAQDGPP
jgi:hypothetical protein